MILIYLILLGPYLFCCYFAVPTTVTLATVGYAVAIPGCYIVGLFQVLALRPQTLSKPRWFPRPPEDGEPAELGYFHGFKSPALAEVEHVARVAFTLARGLGEKGWSAVRYAFRPGGRGSFRHKRLVTVPLGIGGAIGMVPGIAF